MRLLVMGASFEPYEPGQTPSEQATAEVLARWGTNENCLVVDACGLVMLNTAGCQIDNLHSDGYVDST